MGNNISFYSNIQSGGNGQEQTEDIIDLIDKLDLIATYYILTMDFESLTKMNEKEHCESLIGLTSTIIDEKFSNLEVKQLVKRIANGSDSSSNENKQMDCIKIAKFYVKIAHIFASIVTTINPEYTYKDSFGNVVRKSLMEKSLIPKDAEMTVSKINLCSERVKALKGVLNDTASFEEDQESGIEDEKIVIHPDVCSVNLDETENVKNLTDEPGISELIDLYFDDNYDYKTGKFIGMTPETEKIFQDDLKRFYLTFTDNTGEMPPEITKFSDIKLRDYSKKKFCKTSIGKNPMVVGSYKDELFLKYANNLKSMIQNVNKKQNQLLSIINRLFTFSLDPVTKNQIIRINPELDEFTLQELVIQSRELIIELYLNCETDFIEGIKIYEAIVEKQILETTQKQIVQLEKEREKLISPYVSKK
jgi:hypothetical protein